MSKISVSIEEETWKRLMQLKINKNLKTFDDVIIHLLKMMKGGKNKNG